LISETEQWLKLYNKLGSIRAVAREVDRPYTTVQNRLHRAALLGAGTVGPQQLPGFSVNGISTLYDASGRLKGQWVKSRGVSLEVTIEAIKDAFKEWEAPKEVLKWVRHKGDTTAQGEGLTVYPIADLHFGMYAWKEETGNHYDTTIASKVLLDNYATLVRETPSTSTALILNLGDFFHADNDEQRTRRSGNKLDFDTRYARVLREGVKLFISVVELAKAKHQFVLIKGIPGNHDPYGTLALTTALAAFYSDDERVIVDVDAAPIWTHLYGETLLVAAHGHMVGAPALPGVTATRWPKMWGQSTFRYGYLGHIHKHKIIPGRGMQVEVFPTIAPKDAWATEKGFVDGRALMSIVHSPSRGEVERHTVNLKLES
jgi:hypothetical protein